MSAFVEFVFAEFGSKHDVKKAKQNVKSFFPESNVVDYGEKEGLKAIGNPKHSRFGFRMNDYYKVRGLLDSEYDIAIAFDADMRIVDPQVIHLIPLVQRFGLVVVVNPRLTVASETLNGADSDGWLDETNGHALSFCTSFIALNTHDSRARLILHHALRLMEENPQRLPVILWRACYEVGYFPCVLPFQWCICGGYEGLGGEVAIHIGHETVKKYYGVS